jgi:MFS family permease
LILTVFRIRSFRFQLPADLLTSWAFEMETLILGWYVMVHTGSVLLLTAFASLQFLGSLAAPMFGVLGDRLGGRLMLCAMRASYAVFAALIMLLAITGTLTPVWVFAVAALSGIVRTNDLVMRHWLIGETIPPHQIVGALGMSRAAADSARVAGALAGAALSTALGVALAYAVVTALYLVSLALTRGVSRGRRVADPAATGVPASSDTDSTASARTTTTGYPRDRHLALTLTGAPAVPVRGARADTAGETCRDDNQGCDDCEVPSHRRSSTAPSLTAGA